MSPTGKNADPKWDTERTLSELCLLFDRARIEQAETALARGLNAHLAGDLLAMEAQFDRALRVDPQLPRRAEMAPGFASLGASRFALDQLDAAAAAYRRALRLAPDHADSKRWRAELSYLQAERTLVRGVVDMPSYEKTIALATDHAAAADAIDKLSGAWSRRAERTRQIIAVLAIAMLCAFGFGVLKSRKRTVATETTVTPSTT